MDVHPLRKLEMWVGRWVMILDSCYCDWSAHDDICATLIRFRPFLSGDLVEYVTVTFQGDPGVVLGSIAQESSILPR
jgi:hypothetical protein